MLIYTAGRAGLADLHANSAMQDLDRWTERKKALSLPEWTTALGAIRSARAFDPENPTLIETAGRIYYWAALGKSSKNPVVATLRGEALDLFRSAAARRPTSPNTWSNIALVKSKLRSLDREYHTALANAAYLGPWEPLVQLAIAEATLPVWDELPAGTRADARENLGRSLKYREREILHMVQVYKRVNLLCSSSSDGQTVSLADEKTMPLPGGSTAPLLSRCGR